MKIIFASVVLIFSVLTMFCNTGSSVKSIQPPEGDFESDDIYRVRAFGMAGADSEMQTDIQRREMACKAARLAASGHIASLLAGDSKEKAGTGFSFSGKMPQGGEIKRSYDPDSGVCEVIYEIRETALRKKVLGRRQ